MVKGIAMSLLKNFVILVHIVVDYVLEWIGAWWWPDRKACVPLRDNFFVMKSGVEIAEMIRQRKVTVKEVVRAYIDRLNEVSVGWRPWRLAQFHRRPLQQISVIMCPLFSGQSAAECSRGRSLCQGRASPGETH